jgi:hypothetical protein
MKSKAPAREKHLGRNPFKKARNTQSRTRPNPDYKKNAKLGLMRLFVEIPAQVLLCMIKTGALIKDTFKSEAR